VHAEGVVAWINRRLILSGCFQSHDPDFDDAAQVQCRSADKIAKQKYQVTNGRHIMKACVNVVI